MKNVHNTSAARLLRTLRQENLIRNGTLYLRLLALLLSVLALLVWPLPFAEGTGKTFLYTEVFLLLTLASLIVPAVTRFFFRERIRDTARRIDREYGAFNRMEACRELAHSAHPLRESQGEDAAAFFKARKFHPRKRFFLLYFAAVLISGGFLARELILFGAWTPPHPAKILNGSDEKNESPKDSPEAEEKNDRDENADSASEKFFARMEILSPEEEMPAKPFDLIDWSGTADSSAELHNLRLTLYINGKSAGDLPLEKSRIEKNSDGSLSLSGSIDLETLDLRIHDLLAYHLSAETVPPGRGGKAVTVVSQVHFIEVKPFREDVYTADAELEKKLSEPGGLEENLIELIKKIMNHQIAVNKATFTLRMAETYPDSELPFRRKLLEELRLSQNKIRGDLSALLSRPDARNLPADTVNQLEQSVSGMEKASSLLEKISIGTKEEEPAQ